LGAHSQNALKPFMFLYGFVDVVCLLVVLCLVIQHQVMALAAYGS